MAEITKGGVSFSKETAYALGLFRYQTKILGSWPIDCQTHISILSFCIAVIVYVIMLVILIIEIFLVCNLSQDKAQMLCMIFSGILSLTKTFLLRLKSDNMLQIVSAAVKDWQLVVKLEIRETMHKYAKKGRGIFIYQMGFSFTTVTMMILDSLPLPVDNTSNTTSNISSKVFPMQTVCIFDGIDLSWYTYLALYVLQVVQLFYCVIGNIGNDCYFFGLTMHLCAQFELLHLHGKNLTIENDTNNNYNKCIGNFVKKHTELLKLADCLKDSFNFILLIQLAVNAFQICLMGVQMILSIKSGDTVVLVNAVVIILVMTLQIFLYCHAGEELTQKIDHLRNAVYTCYWYNMPTSIVKDISFIMMKTCKNFYITAGTIYRINMDSFMSIIKGMGSYFSILQAIFNE